MTAHRMDRERHMGSEQFTPGPWALRLGSLRASVDTPSGNWFKSHKDGESEASIAADARLIAAAPELYEALDYLNAAVVAGTAHELTAASRKADAVLAKARGEQVK